MELKTLRDLRMEKVFGKDDYMISEFVLKTEAIEWIKNSTDQEHWLKFFNLTEEDLA